MKLLNVIRYTIRGWDKITNKKTLTDIINNVNIAIMKKWTPEEIKAFRNKLGLSQIKFASKLGVTQTYISLMEGGVKKPGKTMKLFLDCLEEKNEMERMVINNGKDKKKE